MKLASLLVIAIVAPCLSRSRQTSGANKEQLCLDKCGSTEIQGFKIGEKVKYIPKDDECLSDCRQKDRCPRNFKLVGRHITGSQSFTLESAKPKLCCKPKECTWESARQKWRQMLEGELFKIEPLKDFTFASRVTAGDCLCCAKEIAEWGHSLNGNCKYAFSAGKGLGFSFAGGKKCTQYCLNFKEYAVAKKAVTAHKWKSATVRNSAECEGDAAADLTFIDPRSAAFKHLRKFLTVTRKEELGKGADTAKGIEKYNSFNLVGAWKLDNKKTSAEYRKAKQTLLGVSAFSNVSARTVVHLTTPFTDNFTDLPGSTPLETRANEKYFYHGTQPQFLMSIVCTGLRDGRGLFGHGVYLADMPEKFDQYARNEPGPDRRLMNYAPENSTYRQVEGDIFYGFLIRGLLGQVFEGKCQCTNCPEMRCSRCGRVKQLRTGKNVLAMLSDPKRTGHAGVNPIPVPDETGELHYTTEDGKPEYDSLYVYSQDKSCITRFNECLVPANSGRVELEYVFAYQRCKSEHGWHRQSDGQCNPVR